MNKSSNKSSQSLHWLWGLECPFDSVCHLDNTFLYVSTGPEALPLYFLNSLPVINNPPTTPYVPPYLWKFPSASSSYSSLWTLLSLEPSQKEVVFFSYSASFGQEAGEGSSWFSLLLPPSHSSLFHKTPSC